MDVIEQLRLFAERTEELRQTRLLRSDFNVSWSLKAECMKPVQFTSQEPDEDDLRSFLLTFRQFISPKEPVFLNRIYSLCQQYLSSDELKGYLIQSREAWKSAQKRSGMRFAFNERDITPEYVTDLWINGFYFHNDQDKRRALLQLMPGPEVASLLRFQFLNFVLDATRQVLYVGDIVTVALKDGLIHTS